MPAKRDTLTNRATLARAPLAPPPKRVPRTPGVTSVAVSRPKRDWAAYNNELVRRGNVFDIVVDKSTLGDWKPRTGRRGQPKFSTGAIEACYMLRAALRLNLRATEGFLMGLFERVGVDPALVPDFSTLSRRRGDVQLRPVKLEPGGVWLIDGTGIAYHSKGGYARAKYGNPKREFVRVTLTTDAATGAITGAQVTPECGPGTGEVSQVHYLLCGPNGAPEVLIGDGAYDTGGVWEECESRGVRLVTPPRITATPGLHPDRDVVLTQVGRLGYRTWKQRSGYHTRSLVESTNGALKSTTGDTTRALTHKGAQADIYSRINLYNRWLGVAV